MLSARDLERWFSAFERTAYHFETQEFYTTSREAAAFRRFRADGTFEFSWARDWLDTIGKASAEGRRFARVRVVTVPLSEYNRFGLRLARFTSEAGEDVRYLSRAAATRLELIKQDYWLFDAHTLIRMHYGNNDVLFGGEIVDDDAEIANCVRWRDIAQQHAVRWDEFEAAPAAPGQR